MVEIKKKKIFELHHVKVHKKTFILKKKNSYDHLDKLGEVLKIWRKLDKKWNCRRTAKYFFLKFGRVFLCSVNYLHRKFHQNRMKFGQVKS